MEIIVLVIIIVFIIFILVASGDGRGRDNREPLARDASGLSMALMIRGEQGNLPNHEDFIHDGTPHRNPAVRTRETTKRFLIFFSMPYIEETRYYPLTISQSSGPNLKRLQDDINRAKLRRLDVDLVMMDESIEREVEQVENQTQNGLGNKLHYDRHGRLKR